MTIDDHILFDLITTIVITILASSGFWAILEYRIRRRDKRGELQTKQIELLRGLAHDRIIYLGMKYVRRGWITNDEYENLSVYLYQPYKALDGNGSADRIMTEINNLKIVHAEYERVEGDSKPIRKV